MATKRKPPQHDQGSANRLRDASQKWKAGSTLNEGDRKAFARRLAAMLNAKNWRPAELARQAFGTVMDKVRGYPVAAKRDSISAYLAGRKFPDYRSLQAMAAAFGIDVEELTDVTRPIPDFDQARPAPAREPAMARPLTGGAIVEAHESRPGYTRLRIECDLPSPVAYEVLALVSRGLGGAPA